jgi:hypothetical protein
MPRKSGSKSLPIARASMLDGFACMGRFMVPPFETVAGMGKGNEIKAQFRLQSPEKRHS